MYLKLALKNAKRSLPDYLLYIFTITILVSVMCVSNLVSTFGSIQVGFQTASLPILIALIMVILVDYINTFMLKRRSKELATYMLLGMKNSKLSLMLILELCLIGAACFLVGVTFGLVFFLFFFGQNHSANGDLFSVLLAGITQTTLYFCGVEILSAFRMKQKLYKSEINRLMREGSHNQPLRANRKDFWSKSFFIGFLCFTLLLIIIVFAPKAAAGTVIPLISIPMLFCIFAFYKWVYALFSSKRLALSEDLYKGSCLYRIAEMTTGTKTGAIINAVFCICLLFSAMSFVFGALLLNSDIHVLSAAEDQWMGLMQISICIIFMVIYFSIISLIQLAEIKGQVKNFKIMFYMGKSQGEIKALLRTQILMKLLFPGLMCFVLLGVGAPMVSYKIEVMLSAHSWILESTLIFAASFALLYMCYFSAVYIIGRRFLKTDVNL